MKRNSKDMIEKNKENKEIKKDEKNNNKNNIIIKITTIVFPIIYIISVFIGSKLIYKEYYDWLDSPNDNVLMIYEYGYKVQFFGLIMFLILFISYILLTFILKDKNKVKHIAITGVILFILLALTKLLNSWA